MNFSTPDMTYRVQSATNVDAELISPIMAMTGIPRPNSGCMDTETPGGEEIIDLSPGGGTRKHTNISNDMDTAQIAPAVPLSESMEELKLWGHTCDLTGALISSRVLTTSTSQEELVWPLGENYFSKRDSEPGRGSSLSLSIVHSEDNIDYLIWSSDTEFNTSPITPAEPTRMVVNNLVCTDDPNREECQEPEAPPPNRGTIVEVDGMDMTGPRSE